MNDIDNANSILAHEIINRLNDLLDDPDVRRDIGGLIEARIPCSEAVSEHPTIQSKSGWFGFLGLLNGLVGTIPDGEYDGWGYIRARFDNRGNLICFYHACETDQCRVVHDEPEDDRIVRRRAHGLGLYGT